MKNKDNSLIYLEDVTKYYTSEGGVGLGLHKVNASFDLGEFVVITGASGSGKTTLLNVITGMDSYEEGIMWIEGEDSTYFGDIDYENYRRKYVSFIFQNYNLIDSFTVYKNIELALIARGVPKEQRNKETLKIIKDVGLEKRTKYRVTKLSGGEKQRVSIARAIASDAPIIACDEITGNLDSKTSRDIIELLRKVSVGKLVLLVSHDVNEALEFATRVIVMHDGSINKDYYTGQEKSSVLSKPRENHVIKKKEVIALSLTNLFSTPGKFILLFFTLLVVSFLLMTICSIYNQIDTMFNSLSTRYVQSMTIATPVRIVVKRDDRQAFTQSDLDEIASINNVQSVFEHDNLFDFYAMASYKYNNIIQSSTFSLLPCSMLKKEDLLEGRLPENENEIVLDYDSYANNSDGRYYIGQELELYYIGTPQLRKFSICGFTKTNNTSLYALYFQDSMIKKMALEYQIQKVTPNIKLESIEFTQYNSVKWECLDTLYDNQVVLDVSAMGYNQSNYVLSNLMISNGFSEYSLFSGDVAVTVNYSDEYGYGDILTDEGFNLQEMDRGQTYGTVYLSTNKYQELVDFASKTYRITVNASQEDKVSDIINQLEKGSYFASSASIAKQVDSIDMFLPSMIIKAVMIFYCSLMFIGISAIVYSVIKNVIKTQQKNFLIMRSIGIDGKKIKLQVFCELLFTVIIAYLPIFIFWFSVQFKNYQGFLGYIHELPILVMLLIFIVMICLMLVLGYRYTTIVVSSTIVNKEME